MQENTEQLQKAASLSVQSTRDSYWFGSALRFSGGYGMYANPLPSIYSEARQRALYWIHQHPQNSLWQGASARIVQRLAGTSAEITGKRRVKYFQDVIMFNADRGAGLGSFVQKIISTWHWSDDGAIAEIIGRGDPSKPLEREAIVGIGVLDPLRCYFTGNWEFPVWYQDEGGDLHEMHYTRVHRFVPYPLVDPALNGRGLSSLSRAISFVQQQIVQQTYIGESLNNEPPPGIILVNGIPELEWDRAKQLYRAAREQNGNRAFRPIMELIGKDGKTVTIEFIPFATPPANFDPIQMTELQARAIALGLDTDPQDVLPLSGGTFGTNTQAKILDRKNRDGGYTYILKMLERFFNTRVLPDYLAFKWNYRDSEQSAEEAEAAQRQLTIVNAFIDVINKTGAVSPTRLNDIVTRYLADNIEGFTGLLTDESGAIIRLYDDDPTEATDAVLGSDEQNGGGSAPALPAGPAPASAGRVQFVAPVMNKAISFKDFDAVAGEFVTRFGAISANFADGAIPARRRAGDLLRQQLRVYGRRAIVEGKLEGGVDEADLTRGEESWFMGWLSDQSKFVSAYTERISRRGVTSAELQDSLGKWVRKSLEAAYSFGIRMAGENGMYEFVGDDGLESCPTCKRLKGQRHRYKVWYDARLRPGVDTHNYDCGGWNCKHKLIKVSGAARGRIPGASRKGYNGSEFAPYTDARKQFIDPARLARFDAAFKGVTHAIRHS